MTDPIADMLTRMRNALAAKHQRVDIPASKMKTEIARILREEGYITSFKVTGEGARKVLRIYLKYAESFYCPRHPQSISDKPGKCPDCEMPLSSKPADVMAHLERVSKPGRRIYVGAQEIPRVLGGLGICVLSTSQGIMTGREARQRNIGGEVVCNVY